MPTAEVGLQLHHRVASLASQPPRRALQQTSQTFGEVRPTEKLPRITILVRALSEMHLPQIRRELRLLIPAGGHVGVRHNHLSPRFQSACAGGFNERAHRPAFFSPHLFIHHQAAKLHLHAVDLVRLRRRDRREQPLCRVEGPVRIVAGKVVLVRPLVAPIAQFRDKATLGVSERVLEDVVPNGPHQL